MIMGRLLELQRTPNKLDYSLNHYNRSYEIMKMEYSTLSAPISKAYFAQLHILESIIYLYKY